MPRVLALSTYPIVKPVHGGQRRIDAFARHLRDAGWDYQYAAIYEAPHYAKAVVGENDIPLQYVGGEWGGLPLIADIQSGVYAATSPAAYAHFKAVFERVRPDLIQLEHPFMWPLVRRLRAEGVASAVPIVYASHNWEGPLKHDMLLRAGAPPAAAQRAADYIHALELELVAASVAVAAVSEADAAHYRQASPDTPVFVVPNGVARPVTPSAQDEALTRDFGDEKYLLFVGSAYPPNIDGFVNLVLKRGLYFRPPVKCLAICGGAAHGIADSAAFKANAGANHRRATLFPAVSDGGLEALKRGGHAVLLPIQFGGGSNLKTAEALASGKWVVATSTALRGFSQFLDAPGVIVADTPDAFHAAIVQVLAAPPLVLDPAATAAREVVYWDRGFEAGGYAPFVRRLATPS